jgi:hypothetical protein
MLLTSSRRERRNVIRRREKERGRRGACISRKFLNLWLSGIVSIYSKACSELKGLFAFPALRQHCVKEYNSPFL